MFRICYWLPLIWWSHKNNIWLFVHIVMKIYPTITVWYHFPIIELSAAFWDPLHIKASTHLNKACMSSSAERSPVVSQFITFYLSYFCIMLYFFPLNPRVYYTFMGCVEIFWHFSGIPLVLWILGSKSGGGLNNIVACQGSGVSSKPTILWTDETIRLFSPLKRWTNLP